MGSIFVEGYSLFSRLSIMPKNEGLPEWIIAEKSGAEPREYYQKALDFMLHNEPTTSAELKTRLRTKTNFDTKTFLQMIPDIMTSVMLDGRENNLKGFLSGWMVQTITDNAQAIGPSGLARIASRVSGWEKKAFATAKAADKKERLSKGELTAEFLLHRDLESDGALATEYIGFKKTLAMAIAFSELK